MTFMPALLLCPGWEHSGGLLSQAPGSVSSVTLRPVLAQEELASGEGVRGHGCSLDGLGDRGAGPARGPRQLLPPALHPPPECPFLPLTCRVGGPPLLQQQDPEELGKSRWSGSLSSDI